MRLTLSTVKKFVPPRRAASRKGENGTVLVLGGSYVYHGAPALSSLAALRCGTDLVYTAVPKINASATRAMSPDLIVIPLADQKLTRGAATKLLGVVPKSLDSAAIGMGLAVQEKNSLLYLVKSLLDMDVRLSLDASALIPEILPLLTGKNVVVTPHAGEFARLFGEAPSDSEKKRALQVASRAAEYGITVLLKGRHDVISDGKSTFVNAKDAPGMTVGGTGDVLSGIVSAMLAKNRRAVESAAVAAFVNKLAGAAAQKKFGLHMVASDLVGELPRVMMPLDRTV